MKKPILISVLACLLLVVVPLPAAAQCGTERWPVKTLADAKAHVPLNAPAQQALLAELVTKTAPDRRTLEAATSTRFPEELSRYQVSALVIGFKKETDSDFHIVLADPANRKRTLIAEIPSSACVPAEFRQQFAELQAAFARDFGKPSAKFRRLCTPVAVNATGVGFFDFLHGQTGVAPNGFELHPLLEVRKSAPESTRNGFRFRWESFAGHLALGAAVEPGIAAIAGGRQKYAAGLSAAALVAAFKEASDALAGRDTRKQAAWHAFSVLLGAGIVAGAWH